MNQEDELIEKYLEGKLTGKSLEAFEERLGTDPAFSKAVKIQKNIQDALKTAGKMDFIQNLKAIQAEVDKPKTKSIPVKRLWLAAAVVMLMLVLPFTWFYFFNVNTNERLFDASFKPYDNLIGTRDNPNDRLQVAMKKYDNEDYEGALNDYLALLPKHPDSIDIRMYAAVSCLAIGKPLAAIRHLKRVNKKGDHIHPQAAKWYLALAYLKSGDRDMATKTLREIVKKGGRYTHQARELLKKLDRVGARVGV